MRIKKWDRIGCRFIKIYTQSKIFKFGIDMNHVYANVGKLKNLGRFRFKSNSKVRKVGLGPCEVLRFSDQRF